MAGTELAKAYVQIVPSAKGIAGSIKSVLAPEASSAGTAAGESIASNLVGKLKGLVAAAGIGTAIKKSLDFGGELQQNLGGTEAVFGDFATKVQSKATEAYKNMGMSASDYMATANKMGSLFQGSGLKQERALNLTTKAMQRAADVASVMGLDTASAMESIAGAAKGNFTMMDNLGVAMNATTLEAYALEKGINFEWKTASNAEKAELAMKMFMDRTKQYAGNFAKESEDTFSGSLGAMKGALEDFMGNLSLGMDISGPLQSLISTTGTFIFNNLLPMLGNIATAIPEAIKTLFATAVPEIKANASALIDSLKTTIPNIITDISSYISGDGFNTMVNNAVTVVNGFVDGITKNAPAIISKGGQFISDLVTGIGNAMPALISGASGIVQHIATGILQNIPTIVSTGFNVVESIANAISSNLPVLASEGMNIINTIVDGVKTNIVPRIPEFISAGKEFIGGLITGFTEGVPTFLENVLPMLESFTGSIRENAGQFIDAGLELIVQLAQGLLNGLPALIEYVPSIVSNIAGIINDNVPSVLQAGWNIIVAIGQGVINAVPALISNFPAIIGAIIDVWSAVNWVSLGTNLINMIKNGVMGLFTSVPNTLKTIGNNAMNMFKSINWSSVGTAVINFIKGGISGLASAIPNALRSIGTTAMSAFKSISWGSVGSHIISGIVSGITGAAGALFGALKSLASNALSAAKSALGIKSPSRVFRDQVGYQIMAGWTEGITGNRDSVLDAITGVAEDSYRIPNKDLNGFIMDDRYGRVSSTNNRIVELLEMIAGKDTSLVIGNKEFKRTLDDFGVAYV